MHPPINSIRICTIMLALWLMHAGRAQGQEQVFQDLNFAFTPPSDWVKLDTPQSPQGRLFRFSNTEHTQILLIGYVDSGNPSQVLDEKFIMSFEKGREESSGIKPVREKFVEMAGVKAYEQTGTIILNGRPGRTFSRTMLNDGKIYELDFLFFAGDPETDPTVQKCIASFRFLKLTPPPQPEIAKTAAYKAGALTAQTATYVAVAFIILGGLGGAIGVSRLRGKSRKAPPPLPR